MALSPNALELFALCAQCSLGALALATEPPSPSLLLDRPHGRTDALITRCMWKHILLVGLYQVSGC